MRSKLFTCLTVVVVAGGCALGPNGEPVGPRGEVLDYSWLLLFIPALAVSYVVRKLSGAELSPTDREENGKTGQWQLALGIYGFVLGIPLFMLGLALDFGELAGMLIVGHFAIRLLLAAWYYAGS